MKFGILQEAEYDPRRRYPEMLEEALFAEEMGFDSYGVSERHFLDGRGVSSPEIFLAALATQTSRMRLRFLSVVLLSYNHPVRVAEQLATLDVLTNGRIEASTARSQQPATMEGFRIDPAVTREQWSESLDLIVNALMNETFSHEGKYWQVPERTLTPKPVQTPHPPLYASATSAETHMIAGDKGLPVISGNSLVGGWEGVEKSIELYRRHLAKGTPISPQEPFFGAAMLVAHCAPTKEQASEEAKPRVYRFLESTIARRRALAPSSPDYAYQSKGFDEIEAKRDDFDHLIERSPYFTVGTPEFFVERCRRLEAMGVDEVILEVEGLNHDLHMQTIELVGKHVIPHFRP
jgi:alkanesulfonate monooxygenase SsuD/methylene tetrahydromethanopterin reductase-like flavin-dependent oxidoreductase (luciferase family)